MEYQQESGDRPKRDADDLLLNGYWTSSRSQKPSASKSPLFVINSTTLALKPTRLASPSPQRRGWPPCPVVEDEGISLAKEFQNAHSTPPSDDPPFRGIIDQYPILVDSNIPLAEVTRLRDERPIEDTTERRFVLIPSVDAQSSKLSDSKTPSNPAVENTSRIDAGRHRPERRVGSPPPLERRRSRQDLPSLKTSLNPEPPSFRRSTSAYSYIPTKPADSARNVDSARPVPSPSEAFLSPELTRGHQSFFDLAAQSLPRKYSNSRPGTPLDENRRSGQIATPNPTGPSSEIKGNGGSDLHNISKQKHTEKLTRPQQVSEEIRQTARRPLSQLEHRDSIENHSQSRKSSARPSRHYYSSSDDQDSSDSGRRTRNSEQGRYRRHATLQPEGDRDHRQRSTSRSNRSSLEAKVPSRFASPLPSPNISPNLLPTVDRPGSRESRQERLRPVSPLSVNPERSRSSLDPSVAGSTTRARSRSRSRLEGSQNGSFNRVPLPIPLPIPARIDVVSPGETHHNPSIPQYDDDHTSRPGSTRPPATSQSHWQPPAFKPPENPHLEKPVGSFRRQSHDIEHGNIAPLPPCPRTKPTRGHIDWLTLPKCPALNICPSCFVSTMAPTEFRSHFVPVPPRSPNDAIICDFGSQPWYRIAWLLTFKEGRKDLNLIYNIANVASTAPPCLGKHETVRKWHSVIDPDTGLPVRNFDVCYSCVKSVETLLPPLRGLFVRTDHHGPPGLPRVCDLRFDSKRFVHYFDALETMADSVADYRDPLDTNKFINLAKRYAVIPECPSDALLHNARWHIITQLPEFTVCPECWDEVIMPELGRRKAIPAMFNKSQLLPSASCQLYSPRMRDIFGRAVDNDDYKLLATKARERRKMESICKSDLAEERRQSKVDHLEIANIQNEWRRWE